MSERKKCFAQLTLSWCNYTTLVNKRKPKQVYSEGNLHFHS